MEFYDSRYFSINKFYCKCLGIWPLASERRHFRKIFFMVAVLSMTVPHLIGMAVNYADIDRLMEHIGFTLFMLLVFLKEFTVVIAEKKMIMLLNDILDNWETIRDEEERCILKSYSERGRKLTIAYSAYILSVGVTFGLLPMTPIVINKLRLSAEPLPRLFMINGEFLVDRNEHYWKIYAWDLFSMVIPSIIIVCVDTTFSACVEHCVGLFAIVRHRLQIPNGLAHDESTTNNNADVSYDRLKNIVQLHHRALRFADTLENTYSLCFLVLMIANFVLIPLVCVMIIMNFHELVNSTRYFITFTGISVHLFYVTLAGQKIIDSGTDLLSDAYHNEWYKSSKKTKKALRYFMLRCTQPSMLTAGGLLVMGMETFFNIMRTSLSYIAVLASFR